MASDMDYGQAKELIKQFFRDFSFVNEDGQLQPKYSKLLTEVANREHLLLTVDLADVEKFNSNLVDQIVSNTHRFTSLFYEVLDEILPSYKTQEPAEKGIMDVFIEQRNFIAARNQAAQGLNQPSNLPSTASQSNNGTAPGNVLYDFNESYPPELIRRVEVAFKPVSLDAIPIRQCLAKQIGKLITVRGIVTRTSDVKPKITVACYTCDSCGCESFQLTRGLLEFNPLFECTSATCKSHKVQGRVTMHSRGSKFVKFQEIKLQEHSDQVPIGHIPRAITVYAHGEQTRKCITGDHVSMSGVLITVDRPSFSMRNNGLSCDVYIEAHHIVQMNKTEDDQLTVDAMSHEEAMDLVRQKSNFIGRLSGSIAPEIYGHEDLKKALLLLLVGGVDTNRNGMKIRGNINICITGDPGVAKSQLLSFIDRLAPRSQYTTGRGSSGVGLTAAVLKDPVTGEMALEGGALVLADQGICCIDEFDKMMDADRTAIHEVMEQQTVSIAKAGILTTLNARVSILAAANPVYGRYNIAKLATENLDLPPALLSRFDLLWLIRDQQDRANDLELGNHVLHIHKHPEEEQALDSFFIDMKTMRRYIQLCKTKNPIVSETLSEKLIKIYLEIRSPKRIDDKETLFTSPRSLLAIIRMSTALARLRLSDRVEEADIDEAYRLYNCSRESIRESGLEREQTVTVTVAKILDELIGSQAHNSCYYNDFIDLAQSRGISERQANEALTTMQAIESLVIKDDTIIML